MLAEYDPAPPIRVAVAPSNPHAAPEWLWPALVSQMPGDRVVPSAKPEALRDAMANCDSRSPKHFRMTVESWPDEYYRSVSLNNETATEEAPELTEETAPEPAESADEIEAESVIQEEDVKMPRMDGGTFSLDASLHGPLRIRRPPHRRDIP
jgi:hypothetical protein